MSTAIDQFQAALAEILGEYAEAVTEEVKDVVKDVAKETVQSVKQRSPVYTGAYRKSWGQTTVRNTPKSLVISIHNKKHYRLTHLLENGHALVGGGRTRAYPHIAPAEREAEQKLLRKVQLVVKGGGR